MEQTELSKKMTKIADRDALPENHPMRVAALKFDQAAALDDAKKLLGAWARARRAYCAYTGEPLI